MNGWLGKSALLLICLLLTQNTVLAYKVSTHEAFSTFAAEHSGSDLSNSL